MAGTDGELCWLAAGHGGDHHRSPEPHQQWDPLPGLDRLKDALSKEPGTEERAYKFIGVCAAECVLAKLTQGEALEIFSRAFMDIEEYERKLTGREEKS